MPCSQQIWEDIFQEVPQLRLSSQTAIPERMCFLKEFFLGFLRLLWDMISHLQISILTVLCISFLLQENKKKKNAKNKFKKDLYQ